MKTCEKCGGLIPGSYEATSGQVFGHKLGCPDGLVCKHGSLRRSCEICERDEQITKLLEQQGADELRSVHDAARIEDIERELAEARAELGRVKAKHQDSIAQWQNAHLNAEARAERLADCLRAIDAYVAGGGWSGSWIRAEIARKEEKHV